MDHIEGDLLEVYQRRVEAVGKRKADVEFVIEVLLLFRRHIVKPTGEVLQQNTYSMYKSYFTIGWRNLLRSKGYSLINIGGLAIGMTVAMLNGLWIWDELTFNKYFDNYDRVAMISESGIDFERGGSWINTTMTYPLGTNLIENYGQQFKRIARTSFQTEKILSTGDAMITSRGIYADEPMIEILSLKMIYGSRKAFTQPQSIIISKSLANALFGTEDPINRTLNKETPLTVTGVFEDFPQNTEFSGVNFFLPWSMFLKENDWIEKRALNDWRNHFLKIYVEVAEGNNFQSVLSSIKSALQFDVQDLEMATKRKQQLELYPMKDWHLYPISLRQGKFEALAPVLMIKLVGSIGVFVLTLACINFVNLSTARAEKRSKEVGIRKTVGSIRSQLISQFFSESFLVVTLAFIFTICLTSLALPGFNEIASKDITIPWTNTWFWIFCFSFISFTSLLAGFYPALYLSSFNPVKALKGTFRSGRFASLPRKVLVVFQFSISMMLIIGTAVVYQQIQYAKDRPVGYDREGLIMMPKMSSDFNGKYELLRNELKNTGVVVEVSESMGPVTEIYSGNNGWEWQGKKDAGDMSFATLSVSHLHGKTVGWQFVKGRDFDMNIPSDSFAIVINESALAQMGLQQPIGEPVNWKWWMDTSKVLHYKIIGVIRDMVMDSPYAPAQPTIFYLKGHNGDPSWLNIRIHPKVSVSEALPKIESVFKKIIPSVPFKYQFADEEYARKFSKEERIGNLASIFSALAIFISCLGLLGLASFVAETRTKEIGIRKVLGATISNLWGMLSKDFIWLVLIACLLATPLAYYFMTQWLEKFVYRTEISWWLLLATAIGAILITLLTVSYQAISTAMMNPVKSLRSE
jgi:ABC-type antimicrobial peptide transport system permease subunit